MNERGICFPAALVWLLVQSMPTALRTNLKGNDPPCGEMCGKQPPLLTPYSWFFSSSSFYQDSSSPVTLSSQLFIISASTLTFALFIWEWVCSGRKFHTHPSLLSPRAASFAVLGGLTASNLNYPLYPLPGNWEMTIFPNIERETPQFLFSIRQINPGCHWDRQHWSFL